MSSPLAATIRSLVEHFSPLDPYAHYECEVLAQNQDDGTLELKPVDVRLGKGLSRVKLDLGPGVEAVKVAAGGKVMVSFKNADRREPRATWILEGILELALKAQSKISISAPQLVLDGSTIEIGKKAVDIRLGAGANFVAAQGDAVALGAISVPKNVIVKV